MGKIERIQVAPEDRERLVKLVKDRNTPQKIVWRSQIVLFAGEGIGAVEVATRVGKSVLTVRRWRRRYASKGVDGLLKDATRPPGRTSEGRRSQTRGSPVTSTAAKSAAAAKTGSKLGSMDACSPPTAKSSVSPPPNWPERNTW